MCFTTCEQKSKCHDKNLFCRIVFGQFSPSVCPFPFRVLGVPQDRRMSLSHWSRKPLVIQSWREQTVSRRQGHWPLDVSSCDLEISTGHCHTVSGPCTTNALFDFHRQSYGMDACSAHICLEISYSTSARKNGEYLFRRLGRRDLGPTGVLQRAAH